MGLGNQSCVIAFGVPFRRRHSLRVRNKRIWLYGQASQVIDGSCAANHEGSTSDAFVFPFGDAIFVLAPVCRHIPGSSGGLHPVVNDRSRDFYDYLVYCINSDC
jgi:hypothetical protein